VDANRAKLAWFVVLFVVGSAALLDLALVAVPGSLLSLAFAEDTYVWFRNLGIVAGIAFGVLLALGALAAAVQLSNAEDWVRNRFAGRTAADGEFPELSSAIHDMALASGMSAQPGIVVLETDAVNAYALGTTRARPTIGVTRGFLTRLTLDEQRAVVATLVARIVAGDIMFGTALAALMGPLKAIRESKANAGSIASGCADSGCGDPGCTDAGCNGCSDIGDLGDADEGCLGFIGLIIFLALVALITYFAVVTAAWIVTVWGRMLQRTAYEKADAEGMLLLKDPVPMASALRKAVATSNEVGVADASYDGIFYAMTSGTPRVERVEKRRYDRLRQVLGTEGIAALDIAEADPPVPPAQEG
jgi:Zn-dependent protease with chaperone function